MSAALLTLSDLGFPSLAGAIAAGDLSPGEAMAELSDCLDSDDNPDPSVYRKASAILLSL